MKKLFLTILSVLLLLPMTCAYAVSRVPYNWHNLPLGGMGFVTGIVVHPTEPDLVYVRTDVGGCYRWNEETKEFIQLCDQFPKDGPSIGIDGIALDANNPDVVYIATGGTLYAKGDVLKSTDRGNTWTPTELNKAFGANTANRETGECIQVDPNNSNVVIVGTRKDGVFITTNGAKTWERVGSIDYPLDNATAPRVIEFDPSDEKDGRTQTIYVGVLSHGLLVTHDAGATWTKMETPFTTILRMSVHDGKVYCATDKGAFKYDGSSWTEISPEGKKGTRMYSINVDPANGDRIVLVDSSSTIYLSTDGGKTWVDKIASGKMEDMLPWAETFGTSFSANNHDTKFDATRPGRVWSTDWFGVYRTNNIDEQPVQKWHPTVKGIEEVVPRDAACPPTGKYRLITAIADIDGFVYEDIYDYPKRMIRNGNRIDPPTDTWMMGSTQIDFCEESPNIFLRPGVDWNSHGKMEYSTDGTETWHNIPNIRYYVDNKGNPTHAVEYGRAAVSAQLHPDTGKPVFVVVPAYNITENQKLREGEHTVPLVSMDYGETWTECKGFPSDFNSMTGYWNLYTPLASDRVNGSKFYMCSQNYVYVSEDWGFTWRQTVKIDGDWYKTKIRTAPNKEGDVWVGMGTWGLWHSTDSAETFQKIEAVGECVAVGFGKEAPGSDNPAVYVLGRIDSTWGAFRSDDMGESWVKLNDDEHPLNAADLVIAGDRQTYGVVYVGAPGRHFYVGVPKGVDVNEGREQYMGGGSAEEDENAIYTVYYDGKEVKFLDIPVVRNGTVYVPVRDLFDYYRFDMTWDNDTQSLIANRPELDVWNAGAYFKSAKNVSSVKFTMDSSTVLVDGEEVNMPSSATRINERMYVPVSSIVDVLGNQIKIDTDNKVVNVYDTKFILNQ